MLEPAKTPLLRLTASNSYRPCSCCQRRLMRYVIFAGNLLILQVTWIENIFRKLYMHNQAFFDLQFIKDKQERSRNTRWLSAVNAKRNYAYSMLLFSAVYCRYYDCSQYNIGTIFLDFSHLFEGGYISKIIYFMNFILKDSSLIL